MELMLAECEQVSLAALACKWELPLFDMKAFTAVWKHTLYLKAMSIH